MSTIEQPVRSKSRPPRNHWPAVILALFCATDASAQVTAQSPKCLEGRIFGRDVSANAKYELCLPSLSTDPAVLAMMSTLNRLAAENADSRQKIDKLVAALDATSPELSAKRVATLATSIASKLNSESSTSSVQVLREIERLRLSFEELQERVVAARSDQQLSVQTGAALGGAAGDAIAHLDLQRANEILAQLSNISQKVGTIDKKVTDIGSDVKAIRDAEAQDRALSILLTTKTSSDVGQTDALKQLIAAGRNFSGHDLSGIKSSKADLRGLRAVEAIFAMADFDDSDLSGTQLSQANLMATSLKGTTLSKATLLLATALFAQASGVRLDHADLSRSSWLGADLRNASFRGANLRGADFELADLRNADFTEADLTNAFFGGADLTGARFFKTHFDNTDLVAAVVDTANLDASQRSGLCASKAPAEKQWELIEATPSQKYDSGFVFEHLLTTYSRWPAGVDAAFARCKVRTKDQKPLKHAATYNDRPAWSSGLSLHLPHSMLEVGTRREDLIALVNAMIESLPARMKMSMAIRELAGARTQQTRVLQERLAQSLPAARPAKTPRFDRMSDAQLVALLKLNPRLLQSMNPDWEFLTSQGDDAWPKLFADTDISVFVNRNAKTTEIYQKWTQARAHAWSDLQLSFGRSVESMTGDNNPNLKPVADALQTATENLVFGPEFPLAPDRSVQGILRFSEGAKAVREHFNKLPYSESRRNAVIKLEGVQSVVVSGPQGQTRFIVWNVTVS